MKLKVLFDIPSKDFKSSEYVSLNVEAVVDIEQPIQEDFEYKMTIPDFMFNELADSEPQFKTTYDQNNKKISGCFSNKTVSYKFQKTQTSTSINVLKNYILTLTQHLLDKYSVENESMKKKIFIQFNHSASHVSNGLNGAYQGEVISQSFRFFTGYEVMTDKFSGVFRKVEKRYITKIEYHSPLSTTRNKDTGFKEVENLNLPLPSYNQSVENFEKNYSIIDWTEEREEFCIKIRDAFIKVNTELESFLKDIDSEKIDKMINSNNFKLLQ